MESSHSRLRSLVSTLLFSDRLLSTSALPWVMQSKRHEHYFPVVVNFSVGVGSIFSMSSDVPIPLESPALGISSIHQLDDLHNPVWLYAIVYLQFNVLPDRPDLLLTLVGGEQLDHRIVHWQRGDAQSDTLWQCDRNCTCPLWLFFCSCLSFSKVFEVDSPISISRSCFSLLFVLFKSRDRRNFPVFSQKRSAWGISILVCGQVQTAGREVHG